MILIRVIEFLMLEWHFPNQSKGSAWGMHRSICFRVCLTACTHIQPQDSQCTVLDCLFACLFVDLLACFLRAFLPSFPSVLPSLISVRPCLLASFLSSVLTSFLPSFLPSFPSSIPFFLHSFHPCLLACLRAGAPNTHFQCTGVCEKRFPSTPDVQSLCNPSPLSSMLVV